MKDWIDISIPLAETLPPWPGDRPFRREVTSAIGVNGAVYNGSALMMSAHMGTHVDAPLHFIAGGTSVDALDLETLIGPAYVLDLLCVAGQISEDDLRGRIPPGTIRLLLKTRNSRLAGDGIFHSHFTALTVPAVEAAVKAGVRLLGLDYYSIAPYDAPAAAHRAFLGATGAVAVENIDLSKADEGWYDLICLPLPVVGGDGAPARALIRKREESP